ncbi:MAG: DAK2 domain-containing protein, partial [SAR324 cluster bacterium]|nr:DAK2 domain-containing protein [SAR324 cluster bacterium]
MDAGRTFNVFTSCKKPAPYFCDESELPAIDAINVFPVPDGDTGRNMAQTLRAAGESAAALPQGATFGELARAAADGALLGARGNSGRIPP